jgi:hypothetical protein
MYRYATLCWPLSTSRAVRKGREIRIVGKNATSIPDVGSKRGTGRVATNLMEKY